MKTCFGFFVVVLLEDSTFIDVSFFFCYFSPECCRRNATKRGQSVETADIFVRGETDETNKQEKRKGERKREKKTLIPKRRARSNEMITKKKPVLSLGNFYVEEPKKNESVCFHFCFFG